MLSSGLNAKSLLDLMMQGYGRPVTIFSGDRQTEARAFLRPITERSQRNMRTVFRELGAIEPGTFLYLGPAAEPIAECDCIRADGEVYIVRRAEPIELGGDMLYQWGLLTKGGAKWSAS